LLVVLNSTLFYGCLGTDVILNRVSLGSNLLDNLLKKMYRHWLCLKVEYVFVLLLFFVALGSCKEYCQRMRNFFFRITTTVHFLMTIIAVQFEEKYRQFL